MNHRKKFVAAAIAVAVVAVMAADQYITRQFRVICYNRAEDVPRHRVALLLGTGKRLGNGLENPYYRNRIDAAAQLWQEGRVDYILASGDNSHRVTMSLLT